MLAFVLTLCAWTTASGYNLTVGTHTQCGVTFTVGENTAATAANADAEVTIVIVPTAGYGVSTVTATAYMNTGGMQAPRRTSIIEDITISPTASANEYTFTMPAANVKVDVVCVASTQTLTFPDGLTVEDWTDPTDQTKTGWKVTDAKGNEYIVTPKAPKTGETVSITPTPAAGWQVKTPLTFDAEYLNSDVIPTDDDTDGVFTYTQPGYGGMLIVPFEKTAYTVTAAGGITGGTVNTFAAATRADGDPENPAADAFYVDDVVTMTVTPTEGMHLKSLTVSFAGQTATVTPTATATANQYQFTMLAGNATVSAEFTAYSELNTTDPAPKPLIYDADLTPTPGYRELGADEKPGISSVLKAQPGDATDIVIEWYYIDNNGDPITPAIGTGETYTVVEADLGKQLVYVIKQTKDADGQDLDPIRTKKSVAVEIGKGQATISYATATVEKDYTTDETAKSFTNPLTHAPATATMGLGTIAYSSNNTNVATVDADGKVTIVGAGSATITATVTDSEHYTYSGMEGYNGTTHQASVSYTLTVNKATGTISFDPNSEEKTYGDAAFTKTYSTMTGNGSVTYSSNNTNVATVVSSGTNAGRVTIVGAGTATITANMTASTNYTAAEATYTLTVNKKAGTIGYNTTTVNKSLGDAAFTNSLSNTGDGTVTYAVSDETKDVDCTSEHVATVNATTGQVTITGYGTATITATVTDGTNYTYGATTTASYTLNVAKGTITASASNRSYTYNGTSRSITVTVTKPASGYTIQYSTDNSTWSSTKPTRSSVGTTCVYYKVTAPNYSDKTGSATVTINRATGSISFDGTEVEKTYGDANFTKTYSTKTNDGASVTYSSDNTSVATVNASTGEVTIHNTGEAIIKVSKAQSTNYTAAEATYTLTVKGMSLSTATFGLSQTSYEYDGNAKCPTVYNAELGTTTLAEGTDYYVEYQNNVDAGEAEVYIIAKTGGNYKDYAYMTYTIRPKQLTTAMVGNVTAQTYTGSALTPAVTVTDGSKTLESGTDYTISYENNTNAGTATATVTGQGNYQGDVAKNFTISPKGLTADMVADIAAQTYTGSALTPALTITYGDQTLVSGTDYTVSYSNNINVGQATVTVTGHGNYTDEVSTTFTIANNTTPDTEGEASVNIGTTGKTTYTGTRDLDFTGSEAQAYVAVGYDATEKELTLARIYKVPAGTPILIKGSQGLNEIPFTNGVSFIYKNMFVGNASNKTVEIFETDGSQTNYVLTNGEFKSVNTNAYVPTGKAYLQLPTTFPATHAGSNLTVTLTSSGKTTLCSTVDLDFSSFTDMYAYAATGYDVSTKTVMLSRVLKASAGTPLILKGQSNGTYTIPSTTQQTTFMNMFVGNNSGAAIEVGPTDGNLQNYYLSSGEFKSVVDKLTVPDGKCYLQLPASTAAARQRTSVANDDSYQIVENNEIITIRLDDASNTTDIDSLLKAAASEHDVYYNLKGQRVENPGKGIYVKNGRKVVIK